MIPVNDGSRPSRLQLDRQLVGELPGDDSPLLAKHRAQVEALTLPAFDAAALRQRADQLEDLGIEELEVPRSEPRGRAWFAAIPLLAAALALFFLLLPPDSPTNRAKGGVDLDAFVDRGAVAEQVADGAALAQGDRLRFSVAADGHESVVLLSVDGRGAVSLFYPERVGDPPVPVSPDQRVLLEGAVQLDDATGPEVFVAVFSPASTAAALALVEETYVQGGHDAVIDLARSDPGFAVLPIRKAP